MSFFILYANTCLLIFPTLSFYFSLNLPYVYLIITRNSGAALPRPNWVGPVSGHLFMEYTIQRDLLLHFFKITFVASTRLLKKFKCNARWSWVVNFLRENMILVCDDQGERWNSSKIDELWTDKISIVTHLRLKRWELIPSRGYLQQNIPHASFLKTCAWGMCISIRICGYVNKVG